MDLMGPLARVRNNARNSRRQLPRPPSPDTDESCLRPQAMMTPHQSSECIVHPRASGQSKTGKVVGAPTLAGAFHCGGRAQGVGSALRRWSRLATFLTAIC